MITTLKPVKSSLFHFILAGLVSGCTNNYNINAVLTTVQATIPSSGTPLNNQGTFTLSRVVKNNLNPTGTLDLIGDGTGTFGLLCQSTGTGNTCNCTYSYSSPTVPNQKIDLPVTYSETNLIRCNYGTISSDITSLKVSIHLTTTDTYSNEVTFNYSGTGVTLNTSLISSFVQPKRYQCHDILVGVNYLFDSKIYDPIISEDFHKTFPLDFYYTNPGGNLSTYSLAPSASGNTALNNWICPPILNPETAYAKASDLLAYSSQYHVNLAVYSKTALDTGSVAQRKVIYPPPVHPLANGDIDRSTFFLAKKASGIFGVPVNGYVSPGVNTSSNSTSSSSFPPAPLGYGASPISTGTGQETCPGPLVPIPSGHHWVKLWLFRASLNQRTVAWPGPRGTGANQASSLFDLAGMFCNPGDWSSDPAQTVPNLTIFPVLPGCPRDILDFAKNGDGTGTNSNGLYAAALSTKGTKTDNSLLADRYLETGQCVRLDAVAGAAGVANQANYTASPAVKLTNCTSGPGLSCNSEGADFWATWVLDPLGAAVGKDAVFNLDSTSTPAKGYPNASGIGCNASTVYDPLNVCTNVVGPQTKNVTAAAAPFSMNVSNQPLDTGSSRFDFLYVVTPTNIHLTDMRDVTSAGAPYQPYRFETDLDCVDPLTGLASTDPDASATATNCKNSTSINTFGLKLHDVGSNGDAPASDPSRGGVFPVCALQPD